MVRSYWRMCVWNSILTCCSAWLRELPQYCWSCWYEQCSNHWCWLSSRVTLCLCLGTTRIRWLLLIVHCYIRLIWYHTAGNFWEHKFWWIIDKKKQKKKITIFDFATWSRSMTMPPTISYMKWQTQCALQCQNDSKRLPCLSKHVGHCLRRNAMPKGVSQLRGSIHSCRESSNAQDSRNWVGSQHRHWRSFTIFQVFTLAIAETTEPVMTYWMTRFVGLKCLYTLP